LDEGLVKGIIFAEIKTEKSTLSTRERQIRDAVQAGKVSWVEIRHQLNLPHDNLSESDKANAGSPSVEQKASDDVQSIMKF